MSNKPSLTHTLQEILAKGDFDRLQPFCAAARWKAMTARERQLLALTFVAQGESLLKKGEPTALDCFERATKVAPEDSIVLYRLAMAYTTQEQNIRCLTAACEALDKATQLNPQFWDAWCGWGCLLVRLGIFHGEVNYFHEANKKFSALAHHSQAITQDKQAEIYWQWGLCWFFIGRLEGEAHDFNVALDKYRQAADLGMDHALFWNNYGDALAELASLVGRKELFNEAAELYRKAVKSAPDEFQGWLNLACSLERVYEHTHQEPYFDMANESFNRAAELMSEEMVDLWLNWGALYAESAKHTGEIEHFDVSFEKFKRADAHDPNNPIVLARWSEVQTLCGGFIERVDLLREAEAKIMRSLEIHPENPDAWCIYGHCLNELGRFFADEKFYQQAIEKLRYGLSLSQRHGLLWHSLALSHFAIGELRQEVPMIEQAVRHCAKAMEHGCQNSPQCWNDWGVALMKLAELTEDQSALENAIDKFERAIRLYETLVDKPSYNLELMYNYGCAFDFLGELTEDASHHERAVQILSDLLQRDPFQTDARYNLALALVHLGNALGDIDLLQKALEQFELLVSHDNEDESVWNEWGLALLSLADLTHDVISSEQCQLYCQQAEEKLMHALTLGCTAAYYNLACLHSILANYPAAMHFIERAERAHALPHIDDIMNDEWLATLRETPDFRNFIALRTTQPKDPDSDLPF